MKKRPRSPKYREFRQPKSSSSGAAAEHSSGAAAEHSNESQSPKKKLPRTRPASPKYREFRHVKNLPDETEIPKIRLNGEERPEDADDISVSDSNIASQGDAASESSDGFDDGHLAALRRIQALE